MAAESSKFRDRKGNEAYVDLGDSASPSPGFPHCASLLLFHPFFTGGFHRFPSNKCTKYNE
jgi:hypothetical protein